jgi:hypothetical protein
MGNNKGPALLTQTEAARIVGRDPRTVASWVRRGAIPRLGVVIADKVFVRRHVLEALVSGDPDVEHTTSGVL